jgi:hypothetical protein
VGIDAIWETARDLLLLPPHKLSCSKGIPSGYLSITCCHAVSNARASRVHFVDTEEILKCNRVTFT